MLLLLVVLSLSAAVLNAQEDYPAGSFQLAPQIDLDLQPGLLAVPKEFRGIVPDDILLNLPPGFSAKIFAAEGLQNPRFLAWGPNEVLYVSSRRRGQIIALPDADNDGVADTTIIAVSNLDIAHGFAFYDGALYVADTHQVLRYLDADNDHIYEQTEVLVQLPAFGQHNTRTTVPG